MDDLSREAVEVAGRLVAAFPDSPDALSVMAMAHHRFGNLAEAGKWFEKCLQLEPTNADAYHGLGWIALRKGDHEEAATLLRRALEFDPALSDASVQLAQAWVYLGKPNEATKVLESAVGVSGPTCELLYWLGDAHERLNRYEEAKEDYLATIRLDPSLPDAYYRLGGVCKKLGQGEESRVYLEQFRGLRDRDTGRRMARAQTLGDVVFLRYALADVYTAAGQAYAVRGDERLAEEHWLKAAGMAAEDTVSRMELARLYERSGRMEKALDILTEVAEIEPESATYQMSIGVVNARLNRFAEAASAFRRACEFAPRHPDGYHALARLYLLSNREIPEAVKLAETAVELAPTAVNYVLLSAACRKNGDLPGALAAIEQAIDLEPGNDEYRRIKDSLREPSK